jgi:hypothetical protein
VVLDEETGRMYVDPEQLAEFFRAAGWGKTAGRIGEVIEKARAEGTKHTVRMAPSE